MLRLKLFTKCGEHAFKRITCFFTCLYKNLKKKTVGLLCLYSSLDFLSNVSCFSEGPPSFGSHTVLLFLVIAPVSLAAVIACTASFKALMAACITSCVSAICTEFAYLYLLQNTCLCIF